MTKEETTRSKKMEKEFKSNFIKFLILLVSSISKREILSFFI